MTKTPHKYANVIKAWADGETIQWRNLATPDTKSFWNKDSFWVDCTQNKTPDFNSPRREWRIKPAHYSGKFRVAFYRGVPGFSDYNIYIVHEDRIKEAEQDELFVQWLTHWIEYNVEVPVEND